MRELRFKELVGRTAEAPLGRRLVLDALLLGAAAAAYVLGRSADGASE